jgi:hypothetical protein
MPLKAVIAVANTKTKHYEFLYAVAQAPTYSYSDLKNVQLSFVHSRAAASRFDAKALNTFDDLDLDSPINYDFIELNQPGELLILHLCLNMPKGFDSIQIHAFNEAFAGQRIVQERFPNNRQISPKIFKKIPKPKPKHLIPPAQFAPKNITTTKPNANNDLFPVFSVSPGIHPIANEIPIPRNKPTPPKPTIKTIHPVTPKQLDVE